ncbi:MAG: hypothetical protein PHI05_02765 [Bacilli bacterium]|nr:hypothetical protein [Bacilli bacterium]MDD4547646.1 hypothetical protein [Bacilli bacterium]
MLFCKTDFKGDWIEYSDECSIQNDNAIYLGPNGIGKTTIYDTIKATHPLLGFFSYNDCKDKILKEKNKIKISIRTVDIEKLNFKKQELFEELDFKNKCFKKFEITSAHKAQEYSTYCKDVYNNNENGILNFKIEKLNLLLGYKDESKKRFILQNVEGLVQLKLLGEELNQIKDKFILEALNNLQKAVDETETTCPVCGYNHDKSIIEIYKERQTLFNDNLDKLINKYRIESNKNKKQIMEDIREMSEFVANNNINDKVVVNYIIAGEDEKNINKLLLSKTKIEEINAEIVKFEKERDIFFSNLTNNWGKIKNILKKVFKDEDITIGIDNVEKVVTLNLRREAKTYSTGELNYIVFLINILEFEYSNKDTIIIDDPLSSYDIKKQYEIVFDIINRLIINGKKVIIFTHNINFINIVNSQYSGIFKYKSIDMIENIVYVNDIFLPEAESILNIENLYYAIDPREKLKPWLKLLIEKDMKWEKDDERHKIFHYDDSYSIGELSNDDLVKFIDDFDGNILTNSFELQSLNKIIYLAALRVWIEKKMKDNFSGSFDGINQFFPKIRYFFKNKDKWTIDFEFEKEDLTRKKVLLNQNEHYKSQIIPFHYALSISCDDLKLEILEIRKLFDVRFPIR